MFDSREFHVIPSVREIRHLDKALAGKEEWILLSCAHIGNLRDLVVRCHQAGKKALVNYDLVGGLGSDKTAFHLMKNMFMLDGVMGSSNTKLTMSKRMGMGSIRRVALEDSLAVDHVLESMKETRCNVIELRPSYYAIQYLEYFQKKKDCMYIAGGFVDTKEMIDKAHKAGFSGVTTSCVDLWGYKPLS